MLKKHYLLLLTITAVVPAIASDADDAAARLDKAVAVFNHITETGHGIPAAQLANADCIAVIPGFKKGAAVVGVGFGRGFISCRNGGNWSAPGAIAFETGSLGVQLGGEEVDIVIVSLAKEKRAKLLSERFTIGSDASAAWGNGKTAHGDPNAQILFYGHTKGAFAGFGLDGATLKQDESTDKALYGKTESNGQIVAEEATPGSAQAFVAKLDRTAK